MGSLFGKKKPKAPKEQPPHAAMQDRELRGLYEENRPYTAIDAALGIKPKTRRQQR